MSKHPHRLMLNQKKTWRCTLPGCKYFIHIGLAHILPGTQAMCWECGNEFTLDERALLDDQPICGYCRAGGEGRPSIDELGNLAEIKIALAKAGVNKVSELSPSKIKTMQALGVLPKELPEEPDEIEVYEPEEEHTAECEFHSGGSCTCK